MHATDLLKFFDARAARKEQLVLVTVLATHGSTYSKAGDFILIDAAGVVCGMLSGGCLESDLAVRARVVLESGKAQTATYELAAGDEDIWGLGVGCDGSMTVYLQPLIAAHNYQPFTAMASALRGQTPAKVRIEKGDGTLLLELAVRPPPHILILGAGRDAVPLAQLVDGLGWRCSVFDHRPAYIENPEFPAACAKHCAQADALPSVVDLSLIDSAIVMSHHLSSDRAYLRALADTAIDYVGLLGPPARKQRLLSELGDQGAALAGRLHGPAGLRLGGRGPELIALAIVAHMQQVLHAGSSASA
ncbi:MAG: XdhC family protein [Gammaproteobacteria bacterium]|nr:XdhC family protein [Gammaproteobacteria bacterium]MDH5302716.1 XdhC family protein [Gammaproteobacteria bacterium]MDH5321895.1 XdhC family protein [Gammaproteobacteria bacterium]